MKVVIIGVPRSGKTTLASAQEEYKSDTLIHTDSLLGSEKLEWSQRSERIVDWMDAYDDYIIEGCDAVRGLRKYMKTYPDEKPCDVVVWMDTPRDELSKHQTAFGKGCFKIFNELLPRLSELGVQVVMR
jgi:adenylate kinase family enzyme